MRPVKAGKGVRMTFSRQKEVLEMPNLIEIQKTLISGSSMRDFVKCLLTSPRLQILQGT